MNNDYILVTGGAGFIGSHLSESLLLSGEKVIILDSFDSFYDIQIKKQNINLLEKLNPIIVEGDIRDPKILDDIFSNYTIKIVIHLAAKAGVRPSINNPDSYLDVNLNGTIQILEAMKKYNCKKIVFASSSSLYGNNKKIPYRETDESSYPISPYAVSKKSAELILYTYHHLYQIDVIILRLFTVYGPRQRPDLAIHKFFKSLYNDKAIDLYGDGNTKRDYTYIDDTIQGIRNSISLISDIDKTYQIINLGNQNPISLNDLINKIQKITGKNFIINRLPSQEGDVEITFASIEKAQKLLNYLPKINIEKGLTIFKQWFENHYNIR